MPDARVSTTSKRQGCRSCTCPAAITVRPVRRRSPLAIRGGGGCSHSTPQVAVRGDHSGRCGGLVADQWHGPGDARSRRVLARTGASATAEAEGGKSGSPPGGGHHPTAAGVHAAELHSHQTPPAGGRPPTGSVPRRKGFVQQHHHPAPPLRQSPKPEPDAVGTVCCCREGDCLSTILTPRKTCRSRLSATRVANQRRKPLTEHYASRRPPRPALTGRVRRGLEWWSAIARRAGAGPRPAGR